MAKHYSVLIIDDKGSPVREARLSKQSILICIAFFITILSLNGLGAHQYFKLRQIAVEQPQRLTEIHEHQSRIEHQNKQLALFAESIDELKSKLIALNDFEQKIRIMANLEHKAEEASLYAIGGSMPEDLVSNASLQQDEEKLIRQMHAHIDQIEQASSVQQTSFEKLLESLKGKKNLLAATPSLRPCQGWVSSNFGYRVSPFTGRKELHKGLDIASRAGTPIIAPANGVVIFAEDKWLMGNMIAIDHGYGMVTRYGHLEKFLVKTGDRVTRGETIAMVGNTGRSTGPHLHYEVRLNGIPVNPEKYILD